MDELTLFYIVSIAFPAVVTIGIMLYVLLERKRRQKERGANKTLFGLMEKNIDVMRKTIATYEEF